MDKKTIKKYLSEKFLSEVTTPGISLNNKIRKENDKINKNAISKEAKDSLEYNEDLKQDKDTSKMAPNKFNYSQSDEKTYHDEMEIMNGQEMIQYDNNPSETFTERAKEGIEGSTKMGNKGGKDVGNAEEAWGASSDEFGKNLVKKIKSSVKKRNEQTPTSKMFGNDWEVVKSQGSKPRAIDENSNNKFNNNDKPQIKETMKRLRFKNEFKGLGNALKLIPETYKVNDKVFEMTDGNETYKIRWEGSLSEGKAVVLTASDKNLVNEDITRMKELFGYKSQETLGLLKGNARINEDKMFSDIWGKTKQLMTESEDIESAKASEGHWEEETKSAPEAKKHIQGSTSTDKGTKAPKAKEGDLDDAVSHAPEAKKHIEGSESTDKGTKAPKPKEGHWEDAGITQAPEAKKHVHLKESEEAEEIEESEETTESFDIMNEEPMDVNEMMEKMMGESEGETEDEEK